MKRFILLAWLILAGANLFAQDTLVPEGPLTGYEGPYVMHTDEGVRVIAMDGGVISDTTYAGLPSGFTLTVRSNDGTVFDVPLHRMILHQWKQNRDNSRKTLVISDLHGRMDALVALLKGNGVVDERLNWKYGRNRLMFLGDALDRGRDDTAIVWLLYKLEAEAAAYGGEVIFMYGNHEDMVMKNDLRYVHKDHLRFAGMSGIPYAQLWGRHSELGRWIRGGRMVFVLGENLFAHAGLSPVIMEEGYTGEEMNTLAAEYIGYPTKERAEMHPRNRSLFGSSGPLWYRGMASSEEKYAPLSEEDLMRILAYYEVKRVFIGHSEVNEVESRYGGRVIAVNVKHRDNFPANRSGGALIKGKKLYMVDYEGKTTRIR